MKPVWYNLEGDTPVPVSADEVQYEDRWQLVTEVGNTRVSTVFIMMDHSFGGEEPILFETLVFGGPLDGDGERYRTKAEAEAGHLRWVCIAEEALENDQD